MKICNNPWCKAAFMSESEESEEKTCPKCRSFDSELSAGVVWREKEYEGPRWDSTPHQVVYKIKKFF